MLCYALLCYALHALLCLALLCYALLRNFALSGNAKDFLENFGNLALCGNAKDFFTFFDVSMIFGSSGEPFQFAQGTRPRAVPRGTGAFRIPDLVTNALESVRTPLGKA